LYINTPQQTAFGTAMGLFFYRIENVEMRDGWIFGHTAIFCHPPAFSGQ
jgi:hypothetical protein